MSGSVSTKEAVERQQCLDSLDEFIVSCHEKISNMLDMVGWTPEHFMQPRNMCVCPYDSNHHVPKASLESHKIKCNIACQGYNKEDVEKIAEDTSYYYADSPCVYPVKLDLQTLNSVLWNHHVQNHSVFYGYKKLPLLPEEEQELMSREDRLGLAEYIIKRAKEANRLKELGKDELLVPENLADLIKKDTEERKLDPFEEMAALRDFRRRRQTYRAKNVHITKKSHTEIMREVINNQMEMFSQSLMSESDQPYGDSVKVKVEGDPVSMEMSDRLGQSDTSYRDSRTSHDTRRKRYRSRSSSKNRSHRRSYKRSRSRSKDRESYSGHRSRDSHTSRSRESHTSRSRHSTRYKSRSRSHEDSARSTHRDRDRSVSREGSIKSIHRDRSSEKHVKSTHRDRSRSPEESVRSSHRDRDRSPEKSGRSAHKDKSRSRSTSTERSKKSKHKKHKHKHKKGKKSKKKNRNDENSGDSVDSDSREPSIS